jgi:hypothetical protein
MFESLNGTYKRACSTPDSTFKASCLAVRQDFDALYQSSPLEGKNLRVVVIDIREGHGKLEGLFNR